MVMSVESHSIRESRRREGTKINKYENTKRNWGLSLAIGDQQTGR
jgi:hypothetical protein